MKYTIENEHIFPATLKTKYCFHFFYPLKKVTKEQDQELYNALQYLYKDNIARSLYVFTLIYPYEEENDIRILPRYFEPYFTKFLQIYKRPNLEKKFNEVLKIITDGKNLDEVINKIEKLGFVYERKIVEDHNIESLLDPSWTSLWNRETFIQKVE